MRANNRMPVLGAYTAIAGSSSESLGPCSIFAGPLSSGIRQRGQADDSGELSGPAHGREATHELRPSLLTPDFSCPKCFSLT